MPLDDVIVRGVRLQPNYRATENSLDDLKGKTQRSGSRSMLRKETNGVAWQPPHVVFILWTERAQPYSVVYAMKLMAQQRVQEA